MIGRRQLLKTSLLAPLAPIAGVVSARLGTVGLGVQKVTTSTALRQLSDMFARENRSWPGFQRFVYSTDYPAPNLVVARVLHVDGRGGWFARTAFNAGAEAVHYAGKIIPPGVWTALGG